MFHPPLRPNRIGRSRPIRRRARVFPLVWDALEERRLLSGFTVSYRVQTSAADSADTFVFPPRGQSDRDDENFTDLQDVDQVVQADDLIDPLSEVSSEASTTVTWTGIPSDTTGTIAFAGSTVKSDPGGLNSSGVTYNQTDMTVKFLQTGWLTLHYRAEPGINGEAYAFNHFQVLGSINVGTSEPYGTRQLVQDGSAIVIGMVSETRLDGTKSGGVATSSGLSLEFQSVVAEVAVTSDINPSIYGQNVTFTATVTPNPPGGDLPTGSVDFYDAGAFLGSAELIDGVATLSTDALGAGDHNITATYSGDDNYGESDSDVYTQSVMKAATFFIGIFPRPSSMARRSLPTPSCSCPRRRRRSRPAPWTCTTRAPFRSRRSTRSTASASNS